MRIVISILMIILLLILFFSCSKRVITNSSDVKDSVHIEYVTREVPVYIPGDTVTTIEWIECDSTTNKPKPLTVKKKSGRATLNLKVKSTGQVIASSSCDSLHKVITTLDKEVFRLKHERKNTFEVKTEFKTRRIDVICRWFTGIALIGMIAYAYVKLKPGIV
ncbi:MAG TPA: hypothetical protein VK589_11900 [Chryseolinea sp.]|nr:hypothetical protein [Chryseolinea sp.]